MGVKKEGINSDLAATLRNLNLTQLTQVSGFFHGEKLKATFKLIMYWCKVDTKRHFSPHQNDLTHFERSKS